MTQIKEKNHFDFCWGCYTYKHKKCIIEKYIRKHKNKDESFSCPCANCIIKMKCLDECTAYDDAVYYALRNIRNTLRNKKMNQYKKPPLPPF